jgi:hypothetical protein
VDEAKEWDAEVTAMVAVEVMAAGKKKVKLKANPELLLLLLLRTQLTLSSTVGPRPPFPHKPYQQTLPLTGAVTSASVAIDSHPQRLRSVPTRHWGGMGLLLSILTTGIEASTP